MTEDELREKLATFPLRAVHEILYRATLVDRNPLMSSTRGGRWMPPDAKAVLYTSYSRDGAVAELAYSFSIITPRPSKPIQVHRLKVESAKAIILSKSDLRDLEVEVTSLAERDYDWTQIIGLATFQIGATALQVPSARWPTDNLMILDESTVDTSVELLDSEVVDWIEWASKYAPHFLST